jgi:hypothetical protein
VLRVLLAILLWAASASWASAAGYWTCADGKWVAAGNPEHAMPIKSCGSRLAIPDTQAACEQAGGRWGPAGIFPQPICKMPTHDGGRICGDNEECEGLCLAALSREQRDRLMRGARQKLPMLGKCTPVTPVFGCMAIVKQGLVTGLLCRD